MNKWAYGLLGGTSLVALGAAGAYVAQQQDSIVSDFVLAKAHATVNALTLGNVDSPALIENLNPVIVQLPGIDLPFVTTSATATSAIQGMMVLPRSITVDGINAQPVGTLTCVTPSVLSFETCSTSTCAASTIIASTPSILTTGFLYTSGQLTGGTVVAAGTIVGFAFTTASMSCSALQVNANVIAH